MKMKYKNILLAGAVCTVCSVGKAQTIESQPWTLRQCIDYAIEHNISVQQYATTAEQSKLDVNTAKWARLPDLNASAGQNWSWGRSASPADNSYTNINSANSSFSLGTSIPVFTGLQLPNEHALAKLNLKAAMEDLNKAKEDIAIGVTSAYLQVLFNSELAEVAHRQVQLSKEHLQRIAGLYKVGKASPSELAEAEARVAQDEMTAVQSDNTYKLSLLDLSQLLELPTPEGFILQSPEDSLEFVPLTPPDDIYAEAMIYKPGIKAAEYRLEGADKSIRIAQGAFYPRISLSAGMGSSYYTMNGKAASSFHSQLKNNLSKYVGLSLSVPIFNRFSTRNRVRAARLQQIGMSLQLDNAKKTLYKEIQQAWYNAVAAESKYKSSELAVKANEESFRLMSGKFNNGQATSVEFNEAKLNLIRALSDRLQAKYEYLFRTKILDFYKGKIIE